MFMHGLPKDMAPEQCIIPFIVWENDPYTHVKNLKSIGQYHTFHSVLSFFGISSPIFNEDRNIFYYEERPTTEEDELDNIVEE